MVRAHLLEQCGHESTPGQAEFGRHDPLVDRSEDWAPGIDYATVELQLIRRSHSDFYRSTDLAEFADFAGKFADGFPTNIHRVFDQLEVIEFSPELPYRATSTGNWIVGVVIGRALHPKESVFSSSTDDTC